ncbi:MAG: hypothetical protein ABIQ16_12985 [Polyangiaceae bacterium]
MRASFLALLLGGSCGGYLYPCCTETGGTTSSLAGWCARDPNAASDGNTLGWYTCKSTCKS